MLTQNKSLNTEVEIQLDRPVKIRLANYTSYRLSCYSKLLPGDMEWGYHNVILYVWAMLDPRDLKRFPDPESVSEYVHPDNLGDYVEALVKAMDLGSGDKKKATPN